MTLVKFMVSVALALGLSACGGGGGSSAATGDENNVSKDDEVVQTDENESQESEGLVSLSGYVVDGYIQGATVFFDLNKNNVLDEGEPSTTTDENGEYNFTNLTVNIPANTPLVSIGGVDLTTGEEFKGVLKNVFDGFEDINSMQLTPATTMVAAMVDEDTDIETAKQRVADFLGIDKEDVGKDPIAEFDNNPDLYKQNLKVMKIIEAMQNQGTEGEDSGNADEAFKEFAQNIKEQDGSTFDTYEDEDLGTVLDEIDKAIDEIEELPEDGAGYGNVDTVAQNPDTIEQKSVTQMLNEVEEILLFSLIKGSNTSALEITGNLTLPTSSLYRTLISWQSANTTYLSSNGVVTRPVQNEDNVDLTLTATISKDSESVTKDFNLRILAELLTDNESVVLAKEALDILDSETIEEDLSLPSSGLHDTTITWSSDNNSVLSSLGVVTRPENSESDVTVILTATISKGGESDTKAFTFLVPKLDLTDTQAVELVKDALSIKTSGITSDISLLTSGEHGTTISWSSSDTDIVSDAGRVRRPDAGSGNTRVTLTATISKGDASETKTFSVLVVDLLTDAESVSNAKSSLSIASTVISNLTLSRSGTEGTSISWATSNSDVISTSGVVTRPEYLQENAAVTLTATISKGAESDTKTFSVTVTAAGMPDSIAVEQATTALTLSGDLNNVVSNLSLPSTGLNETTISWASSNSSTVSTSGTVTRPDHTLSDATITLTATISKGAESDTKSFSVTVLAEVFTEAMAVAEALSDLSISGDLDNVTSNLTLPTTGLNTTSITWSSSNPSAVSTSGVVTRPDIGSSDATVTLTATITKGAESDTKTFIVTVLAFQNIEPVANAGVDQTVDAKTDNVILDGTGSQDSDGSISSYAWSDGSSNNATGATPTLTLTQGVYTFTLTVTDNNGASDTDTVVITVENTCAYNVALDGWYDGFFQACTP